MCRRFFGGSSRAPAGYAAPGGVARPGARQPVRARGRADDLCFLQAPDVVLAVAQPLQPRFGLGRQRRRRAGRSRVAVAEAEPATRDALPPPGRLHLGDEAAAADLRVPDDLRHGQDPARRHARPDQQLLPFRRAARGERRLQLGGERFAVRLARVAVGEAGVRLELGPPHDVAERGVLLVLVGGDVDQPVAGAEGAGRGGGEVRVAHRHRSHARVSETG